MARDFNQIRNTNAKLGQATIDKYGNTFAIKFGLDGISIVNNTVQPMPSSIIPYLEGDDTITQFAVPINVDKLCDYALASFPNIEEITLFSLTMVTFDETNLLSYLTSLETVYVPQNLLTTYQSTYPNITFDEISEDYTYVIEDTTQDHVLTSAIVTEQLNALTSQQKNAITKLVIASSYTSESANNIAWNYDFSSLPNLNNNIWYNGVKYDFSIWTIDDTTQDHILTASVVSASVNSIPTSKLTMIEKIIVPIGFTSYASGSITELQAFMNTNSIDKLETCYESGNIELSLSGDIVAKIVEIGKTLDEALVYAKNTVTSSLSFYNKPDLVIVPPLNNYGQTFSNGTEFIGGGKSRNVVYVDEVSMNGLRYYAFQQCLNLVRVKKLKINSTYNNGSIPDFFSDMSNTVIALKEIHVDATSIEENDGTIYFRGRPTSLTTMTFEGLKQNLTFAEPTYYTSLTREGIVNLINSLGTPTTQKTLNVGAYNLAKLTADDIAIATAKGWVVQ